MSSINREHSYVEKVLEALQFRAELTVDLLHSWFLSKREFRRDYLRFLRHGPKQFKHDWATLYRERRKFYNTLAYLKRSGLVQKSDDKKGKPLWNITKSGLKRLKNIQGSKKISILNHVLTMILPWAKE